MNTNLVTATFKAAFEERDRPQNPTFHSNRGTQYIFKTFGEILQKCGVEQSFSATAMPLDNAVTETFFSTFKREEAYRREYTSKQHFHRSTGEYIRFYNEVRPHQTLKSRMPQAFLDAFRSRFIEKWCSNTATT